MHYLNPYKYVCIDIGVAVHFPLNIGQAAYGIYIMHAANGIVNGTGKCDTHAMTIKWIVQM